MTARCRRAAASCGSSPPAATPICTRGARGRAAADALQDGRRRPDLLDDHPLAGHRRAQERTLRARPRRPVARLRRAAQRHGHGDDAAPRPGLGARPRRGRFHHHRARDPPSARDREGRGRQHRDRGDAEEPLRQGHPLLRARQVGRGARRGHPPDRDPARRLGSIRRGDHSRRAQGPPARPAHRVHPPPGGQGAMADAALEGAGGARRGRRLRRADRARWQARRHPRPHLARCRRRQGDEPRLGPRRGDAALWRGPRRARAQGRRAIRCHREPDPVRRAGAAGPRRPRAGPLRGHRAPRQGRALVVKARHRDARARALRARPAQGHHAADGRHHRQGGRGDGVGRYVAPAGLRGAQLLRRHARPQDEPPRQAD